MNLPYEYDYINTANSTVSPSTIHASNTGLDRYFTRYLLQKAMSVFEWKIPETWDKDYFLYTLYCWGFCAVIDTQEYGVIPQGASLRGYNVFYRPTNAIVVNPCIRGINDFKIGETTELIKLQPDYGGIMDIVKYYSNLMALATETCSVNLLNSKLSYVFTAGNKTTAEAFKKMYDRIASGEPLVVVDKNLLREDGSKNWDVFAQNLKENYIANEILSDIRKLEEKFDTDIGIPNANTDKRERLITDEVNANNFETMSKCSLWLENLKECCSKVNAMFGLELDVDWRKELKECLDGSKQPELDGGMNNEE